MKIGIGLKKAAYTPEAYAYSKYLFLKGFEVQLESEADLDPRNDVNIYFMGVRPFWSGRAGIAKEIHEYQSLSTAPHARKKDFLKSLVNKRPSGRIFLNDVVKSGLRFKDDVPFIYRDMGVDVELFQRPSKTPEYDIVYCGSVAGRVGLIDELLRLESLGFKLLVVGNVGGDERGRLKGRNINCVGRVSREDLPELYRNCRFGLNYTPDIYPFNIQTSTKTLEYIAAGLGVISNRYPWVEKFCSKFNFSVIWLSEVDIDSIDSFQGTEGCTEFIKSFCWEAVLDAAGLDKFLMVSAGS